MTTHRALLVFALVAPGSLAPAPLASTEPAEGERTLCDPRDLEHGCPGRDCRCTEDALEIAFRDSPANVLELVAPEPGATIEATVVLDTRSERVAGWSYGVDHDDAFLSIRLATTDGTDGEAATERGFFATYFTDIISCRDDPDPRCSSPEPATGFVSAGVLDLVAPVALEVRRNTVARVEYILESPPGPEGTRIEIVGYLGYRGGVSRHDILLTAGGRSVEPGTVVDGIVRPVGAPAPTFRRGDYDANGRLEITDALGLLGYLFLGTSDPSEACLDAGDADDNGILRGNDAVLILGFLFLGGPPPSPPGPSLCGPDVAAEDPDLGCARACR